ncbi:AbrB family transcriptional regulator [Caldibacillus lycopersici]|uniref:AbrB family transcriptional regulator n=1 Tax=Perspicuibacillus lycopersici TaxID=1325689 RepID=A0AAE3LS58_9BACI|nr:AbrB family transcriptional regulator [Perspicuibacillus lycopersici]MCU9612403.1 AbrB family transcriptional regulator [Perspicuibacillus lycopersici]
MLNNQVFRLLETFLVATFGGYIFSLLHLPLPWVLGALSFVMLWQGFMKRKAFVPNTVKNSGFIILGLNFGLYFTKETFETASAYFLPYVLITIMLIIISMVIGIIISKWIKVDKMTSVFSCIPGGLSEMTVASESLHAKSSFVAIFQTVRLVTVLFTVPSVMSFLFLDKTTTTIQQAVTTISAPPIWNYLWFIIPIAVALFIQNKVPAGIIIGALGFTALLNLSPIELPSIPIVLMHVGQILVGAGIGKNINFQDLKIGGKYSLVYFGASLTIIAFAFGLGMIFASFTSLNYATAILSIAPGGLFEMVVTAYNIGGDPAIVSALQLTRILMIVLCVPPFMKWKYGVAEESPIYNS